MTVRLLCYLMSAEKAKELGLSHWRNMLREQLRDLNRPSWGLVQFMLQEKHLKRAGSDDK